MRMTLLIHILAGGVGLISGFMALYSAKGAPLHRKAGIVFVYAMLTMCAGGIIVAVVRGSAPAINIPAALLTAALVITSLTTVRPASVATRWLDRGATAVTLAVGVSTLIFGFEAVAGGGRRNGMPAFPFFMFGVVGVLATAGDFRVMRSGRLAGAARIARHLWRMTFALFVASMSFFIGQAKVIPEPLRIRPLLALPVLMVLLTMFYWLWRVRVRRFVRVLAAAEAS